MMAFGEPHVISLDDLEASTSTSVLNQPEGNAIGSEISRVDLDGECRSGCKRTNFRQEERDALVELILDYISIIENKVGIHPISAPKGLNGISSRTEAWHEITKRFNMNPNFSKRDENQLRKCWMNMKNRSQFTPSQRGRLGFDQGTRLHTSKAINIRVRHPPTQGGFNRFHIIPNSLKRNAFTRINKASAVLAHAKVARARQRNRTRELSAMPQASTSGRPKFTGFDTNPLHGPTDRINVHRFQGVRGLEGNSNNMQYIQQSQNLQHSSFTDQSQLAPVAIQRATSDIIQPGNVHRLLNSSDEGVHVIQHVAEGAGTQISNHDTQRQLQNGSMRVILNVNRTRPNISQESFSQGEQFTPLASQRVESAESRIEFLDNAVDMESDSTQSVRSNANERSESAGNLRQRNDQSDRIVTALAILETSGDGDGESGAVIVNVKSVNEPTMAKEGEEDSSTVQEVELVIKTEVNDNTDDRPENHDTTSLSIEKKNSEESSVSFPDSQQTDILCHRISDSNSGTDSNLGQQGENLLKSTGTDCHCREGVDVEQPATERCGSNENWKRDNPRLQECRHTESECIDEDENLEDDIHYVDDDEVMGDEGDNDDGFIRANPDHENAKEHGNCDDEDDTVDDRDRTSSSDIREHSGERSFGHDALAEEERRARLDILYYQVQKAREEAEAAKCRRELLQVEVDSAKQQLELSRIRQEAEIDLIRQKIRQEKAKADKMI